jgi:hypothetical protein
MGEYSPQRFTPGSLAYPAVAEWHTPVPDDGVWSPVRGPFPPPASVAPTPAPTAPAPGSPAYQASPVSWMSPGPSRVPPKTFRNCPAEMLGSDGGSEDLGSL